uniref:Glycerol-3-phosphate phosphatase n=1 Tax=Kryptolebias marmoratus TaxID=37003 RepID=A0A3Q3A122_KRYMA
MSGTKCTRLSGAPVRRLLDSVDSVLFDCDGVIWRGDQAVPGACRVIDLLKEHGKKVFFVTNNSSKTRRMYAEKMSALGFGVSEEEVFGTAYCCAAYLRTVCELEGKKVYLIGSAAMAHELEAVGIRQTGVGPDHVSGKQGDWAAVPLDPDVRAVVVGFDEHFSYMKLNRALQYLLREDCLFVGTNRDTRLPLEGGKAVPTGCLLQAVETAAQRRAQTVGKPNHFMFDCVASHFGVQPERCLMVGDRLDTDILLGSNCGLKTLLTLTGVSTVADAEAHRESGCAERQGMVPDYYVDSIADLLPAL